ncbi:MAG: GNAT family N-acetyltransferase [Spirochaetaceae bacterium]|nr:MAG: GNAT family N-acetyltransferase [Spirochaetaceae bacterium]
MHETNSVITPIRPLTPELERRVERNPLLHIDTFVIPSPYVKDSEIEKDYRHSYVWIEEDEILGFVLVYSDRVKRNFHIYKLVTSPFGRGRGIGTLFIEHLARAIPAESTLYLYVWEKQADTLEFFQRKGFAVGKTTVYRNLIYYHMHARREQIKTDGVSPSALRQVFSEEIGRTRHDAKKTIRLLAHMVEMLSIDNCGRIIEDINRETTTLINILNAFRDTVSSTHAVNVKDLILERIIPYIEASSVPCSVKLTLDTESTDVLGYYVNFGRALVNLVANALEAIAAAERKGVIEIELCEEGPYLALRITDNGTGIDPALLEVDEDGYPAFVGKTTKGRRKGEGLGTVQIYSTFGVENISVESMVGDGTSWVIRLPKAGDRLDRWFIKLEQRFHELKTIAERTLLRKESCRTEVVAYIWQLRKIQLYLFDLILQFGKYHNVRTIFRSVLAFLMGRLEDSALQSEIDALRSDYPQLKSRLMETAVEIKSRFEHLHNSVDCSLYRGAMFKSYGQAMNNVIIFTLDPANGRFYATDRKLAEHLDFVPYLDRERDELLRGEFIGDVNELPQPIVLGVWSVESDSDLREKLRLLREGARKLIEIGVYGEKNLSFYRTTHVRHGREIDSDRATTLARFASCTDEELWEFTTEASDELGEFLSALE